MATTFKACWGNDQSEPATMATTFKACWGISPLSAVKATVSLLQWQRQAPPPTPLRQPPKRACYNRHLLQSTSQRACYKRLLKRAWAITSYIKRIRGNTGWFRSRWMVYGSDEDIACWRREMMLRLCCNKLLWQAALLSSSSLIVAASPWLLQPWLDAKQQLLYTEQLSPVSTLHAFNPSQLHSYDLSLCWSWQF